MQNVSIEDFLVFLRLAFGDNTAKELYDIGLGLGSDEQYEYFKGLVVNIGKATGREMQMEESVYRVPPVDVETFLLDPYYLNLHGQVFPEVMPYVKEVNSGKYVEAVFTGGIGSAKTTIALWTTAYQLYLLSITRNPHSLYGISVNDELIVVFQNITEKLARTVDYPRFKEMITRSPYFQQHFPHDDSLESEMNFPNRIIVKPVSGSSMATIGQNVIGGLIDELNYMAVIEKSSRAVDAGTYNQAVEVYNSIARRRKSRFLKEGKMPGILCLVSSKRYPGQFTDTKEEEAKTDPTIFIYNKRVWDIKPESFSKRKFPVFIGDDFRKPRILEPGEKVPAEDQHLIDRIPEDFRVDFEKDIINALRELAGVSNLTKSPFIPDPAAIARVFVKRASIFSRDDTDFDRRELKIIPRSFVNPEMPRFCHIDLAVTGDSVGLTIGHVNKFVTMDRGGGVAEVLPNIYIDGALEVTPPRNGEILFYKLRRLLYMVRSLGLNLRWVTFDAFQSVDSIQLLRQKGYAVGLTSMDKETTPYDFTKAAIYDKRISIPTNPKLLKELRELQFALQPNKKFKVDHLPNGSKDVADSLAGVVFGLTMRREVWGSFNIPLIMIPESIKSAIDKDKAKIKEGQTETAEEEAA
jgi:hypothetical protein